jgi:hypothetical protein
LAAGYRGGGSRCPLKLWREAGETVEGYLELVNRLYEKSQVQDQKAPSTATRKKKKSTRAVRKK